MSVSTMRFSLTRFLNTRTFDRLRTSSTIYLVFLGPFLAFATYIILGPFDLRAQSRLLQLVLLADLVYVITIVISSLVTVDIVIGIIDISFALMCIPNMIAIIILSPLVNREMKNRFWFN